MSDSVGASLVRYARSRGYVSGADCDDLASMQTLMQHHSEPARDAQAAVAPSLPLLTPFQIRPSVSGDFFASFLNLSRQTDDSTLRSLVFPLFYFLVDELVCLGSKGEAELLVERFRDEFNAAQLGEVDAALVEPRSASRGLQSSDAVVVSPHTHQQLFDFCSEHFSVIGLVWRFFKSQLRVGTPVSGPSDLEEKLDDGVPKVEDEDDAEEEGEDGSGWLEEGVCESPPDEFEKALEASLAGLSAGKSDSRLPLPEIRFYLTKATRGDVAVSMDVSCDGAYLTAGTENSAVFLCRLRPDAPFSASDSSPFRLLLPGPNSSAPKAPKDFLLLRGHSKPVFDVKFFPSEGDSSRFLLSCCGDGDVRLWDCWEGGRNVCAYIGHRAPVWQLDTSGCGLFASASWDGTARVFVSERLHPLRVLAAHSASVDLVRFHPSARFLATGSSDRTLLLWSLDSATPTRLFQGFDGDPEAMALSSDHKFLACAAADHKLYIWDVGTGRLVREPIRANWHQERVHCLSFGGREDEWLIGGGADGSVRVCQWSEGLCTRFSTPSSASVLSFTLPDHNPHSQIIAAGWLYC